MAGEFDRLAVRNNRTVKQAIEDGKDLYNIRNLNKKEFKDRGYINFEMYVIHNLRMEWGKCKKLQEVYLLSRDLAPYLTDKEFGSLGEDVLYQLSLLLDKKTVRFVAKFAKKILKDELSYYQVKNFVITLDETLLDKENKDIITQMVLKGKGTKTDAKHFHTLLSCLAVEQGTCELQACLQVVKNAVAIIEEGGDPFGNVGKKRGPNGGGGGETTTKKKTAAKKKVAKKKTTKKQKRK